MREEGWSGASYKSTSHLRQDKTGDVADTPPNRTPAHVPEKGWNWWHKYSLHKHRHMTQTKAVNHKHNSIHYPVIVVAVIDSFEQQIDSVKCIFIMTGITLWPTGMTFRLMFLI